MWILALGKPQIYRIYELRLFKGQNRAQTVLHDDGLPLSSWSMTEEEFSKLNIGPSLTAEERSCLGDLLKKYRDIFAYSPCKTIFTLKV